MPVSSLPSRTGVGEMGAEAYHFLTLLKESGVKIWQILPMNPVGYGNSPYQPYSSCAGDELYISLDTLYEEGLLKERPEGFHEYATKVDYDAVRLHKEPYLREAFQAFLTSGGCETKDYQEFADQSWVYEYGAFRALKKANGGCCWNEWKQEDKMWPDARTDLAPELETEVQYHMFLQYVFFSQWMKLKEKANAYDIQILGDVPL